MVANTGLLRPTLRLLPKPTLSSDGRDDVPTRWLYEAVERALLVMKMKAQGYKLDEIAEMVRAVARQGDGM